MLKKEYIDIIVKRKDEILAGFNYKEIVVRDEIFKLLRQKSRILFYPLDEELDLDGFHIERCVNGKMEAFVYINTAKNFEKNIFCAAHELGHIYEVEKNIQRTFPDVHLTNKEVDVIMNRFAAELLMPHLHFCNEFQSRLSAVCGDKEGLKVSDLLTIIVSLMDYYYVPYKAVVWRLWEIGFLTEIGRDKFAKIEENDADIIDMYIYEGKYTRLRNPSRIKSFENLPEYLSFAEQNGVYAMRKINQMRDDFEITISVSDEKIEAVENIELDAKDIQKEFL